MANINAFYETRNLFISYTSYVKPLTFEQWRAVPEDQKAAVLFVQFFEQVCMAYNKANKTVIAAEDAVSIVLQYLEKNGYPVGICSSSAREYVLALIDSCSVKLHYDTIVCGDMVKHAKPDPEIFLKGAENLGVKPENCLVLEDSKQGILASVNAGMHNCFIPDTIIPDEAMSRAIEFRCESLHEVIGLLERINRQ